MRRDSARLAAVVVAVLLALPATALGATNGGPDSGTAAAGPAAPPAPGPGTPAAAPLPTPSPEALRARWAGLARLTAEVTQVKEGRYWARPLESRIRLRYAAGRIEWETLTPVASLVTIAGDRITVAAAGAPPRELDAAKDPRFAGLLRFLRALLALDLDAVERDFVLAYGPGEIVATPREGSAMQLFTAIRMRFDAAGELVGLDLETASERTRLSFHEVRREKGA